MQEIKKQIDKLEEEVKNLARMLNIEPKRIQVKELQLKMSEPNFWADSKETASVVASLKEVKSDVDDWDDLRSRLNDLAELLFIYEPSLAKDILAEEKKLAGDCQRLRLRIFFSGKFDRANAIVEINSGAGGTEACDWASMLFRMYFRWAEDNKFKLKVLSELKGEEAGIKSITFFIEGRKAYGLLRSEIGVHRLVRISPFDANKRRHTSFASVGVLPEIKGNIEIEIKSEDLKVDTFRASGAGGQHVNVTDSAVRITYLPLKIVVTCQNERSQHQNKQVALKILKAKLYERKEAENKKELDETSGKKQKIEWGSQIRSYILHPYLLVKDHRTNLEKHDAWAVLGGKIDEFIYSYLEYDSSQSID
ncbi:MAG: peptide chain release factor 2 [Candidatus Omnitrophica bacterium]|nr:peptide chain release factor 2 [Candidatus Omnitrophota bacterium]